MWWGSVLDSILNLISLAAYHQYTWWIHNRFGRHVRRVIPSCVNRIRAEFEEDDGNYTVFRGDDEIASEVTKAMEWTRIEEENENSK